MRNGLLEMTIGFLRLGGPFKAGRTVYSLYIIAIHTMTWFKHILLVNTKALGVAKLLRKPSPIQ